MIPLFDFNPNIADGGVTRMAEHHYRERLGQDPKVLQRIKLNQTKLSLSALIVVTAFHGQQLD